MVAVDAIMEADGKVVSSSSPQTSDGSPGEVQRQKKQVAS
jgi:hypothetical protein